MAQFFAASSAISKHIERHVHISQYTLTLTTSRDSLLTRISQPSELHVD